MVASKGYLGRPSFAPFPQQLVSADNLTSFCGEDVHTNSNHAVTEGRQALGFFFPKSMIVFERGERADLCLRVFQNPLQWPNPAATELSWGRV